MKKLLLPILCLMVLFSCKKELEPVFNESQNTELQDKSKQVTLCHLLSSGFYTVITVNRNAVQEHLNHGDQIVDADGDGYTAFNSCTGSMDDCDDNDPNIYPAPSGNVITSIRLGGQAGDNYIGPTCDGNGTYRTCFYITGNNLPDQNPDYQLKLDGIEYPIAFFQRISANQVVICALGLPTGRTGVDVFVRLQAPCVAKQVIDLYNAPSNCNPLTGLRLGGMPGDNYIGPTCDNDETYRTCYYITGTSIPTDQTQYKIFVDGVEYPVAFSQSISFTEIVVCVTGLPQGRTGVDVRVELAPAAFIEVTDLYDAPTCTPEITDFRLGGQPGDNYIGPTCNPGGTYRTTFIVTGDRLPGDLSGYHVFLDNVEYPVIFYQSLSPTQAVLGLNNLPSGITGVDVRIAAGSGQGLTKMDLYDAPVCPVSRNNNSPGKVSFLR